VVRRAGAVIDGNRHWRRLLSLAQWAFPDVWSAFAGSEKTALAVLGRWPHLRSLASAPAATLTAVVAEHTRNVAAIKAAARGWADFWDGHLDLDALAVDVTEHLADLQESRARVDRFTCHARQWWEHLYGDDPLILSDSLLRPRSPRGVLLDAPANLMDHGRTQLHNMERIQDSDDVGQLVTDRGGVAADRVQRRGVGPTQPCSSGKCLLSYRGEYVACA
jgi:hypothetical protein